MPLVERDLRIEEYERDRTRCDCGNPVHVCSDPNFVGVAYRRICYATLDRLGAEGLYADLHEKAPYHDGTFTKWAAKRSREFPAHFSEGVTIGVAERDLTPWDPFTTKVDASPVPPSDVAATSGPEARDQD